MADYTEHDELIWHEELDEFVPAKIYDAHIHLFNPAHMQSGKSTTWSYADLETLKQWASRLYPGRKVHFLTLGTPTVGIEVDAHNAWCLEQVASDPLSRLNRLVTPQCSLEAIERDIKKTQVLGLKPYRLYSVTGDIAQCRIHEFLPYEQLELADHHGLWVTMHLSRFHGCADDWNLKDLEEYTTRRYPRIKWILAHCARSFTYWPIRQAIDRLRQLPNIWYDVSAVTDLRPMITLFSRENPRRIFYGSDGVDATYFHGQYAALGRAWQYIDTDKLDVKFPHCDGRPILAIYEQLLSMKQAAEIAHWSRDDVQNMFWGNAIREFQIEDTSEVVAGDERSRTQTLYRRAKQIIPGGTQLLSKRPEMFAPDYWPGYAKEARGCEVVDLDGRRLIDMTTSGIGACLLGYADPDVSQAVIGRVAKGSMSTLNAAEEVQLAELLLELHPWAEQARFARTGGESMALATRLVRAATGRDQIAFCGYHGWSDWYLAANVPVGNLTADQLSQHLLPGLEPAGVPQGLAGTLLPFRYNELDELESHFRASGNRIAAVVMEPTRSVDPAAGFLQRIRQLCDHYGARLVFDEISSGWRMHLGGVHLRYGIEPDVAVFAKALGNGHPIAAVIGRRSVMDAAQRSFISSTYWTEAVGPTAAVATITKFRSINVAAHARSIGDRMRNGWLELGNKTGVPAKASGHAALLHLAFDCPDPIAVMTLYTARMIDRGFLAGSGFYPSWAHREHHVDRFLDAARPVFEELSDVIKRGDANQRLEAVGSRVKHTGFARLT